MPLPDFAAVDRRTAAAPSGLRPRRLRACEITPSPACGGGLGRGLLPLVCVVELAPSLALPRKRGRGKKVPFGAVAAGPNALPLRRRVRQRGLPPPNRNRLLR